MQKKDIPNTIYSIVMEGDINKKELYPYYIKLHKIH